MPARTDWPLVPILFITGEKLATNSETSARCETGGWSSNRMQKGLGLGKQRDQTLLGSV